MTKYRFVVVFDDRSENKIYEIQTKGSEDYADALIKLVRLASLDGKIRKIEKA